MVVLELNSFEIHLLKVLKEVCAYKLDFDFDELFRAVQIENTSDAAFTAV